MNGEDDQSSRPDRWDGGEPLQRGEDTMLGLASDVEARGSSIARAGAARVVGVRSERPASPNTFLPDSADFEPGMPD
jgi:hypothetical protein